jgi:ATP-binding cassette subfamily F protein 3
MVLPEPSRPPLNLASCRNVTKHYGSVEVFNEMDMLVERGQKIGLVGYNGAGKSTLLKMLAGVESVTSGAIRIGNGVDSAYYAQHQLETLDPDETVYNSIQKVSSGWSETEMRTYLGSFMFTGDEIEKHIKVLSGGEKARVAMARMLIKPSHLLLLDEPTNHLDMMTRSVVEMALVQFKGSIVCISHDRHFLNTVTNLTCEVGDGGIRIFDGNYDYYDWKINEEKLTKRTTLINKDESKGKTAYKERKKTRNRLAWIKKRFKNIEIELENQRSITKDPANGDNFELLHQAMETMNTLEIEYLELIDEQDNLLD